MIKCLIDLFGFHCSINISKNDFCREHKVVKTLFFWEKKEKTKTVQTKKYNHPIIGRTFFEPTFGREISNTEIDKLCKQHGYVYADDKDLTKDCERNKKYTEEKQLREFRNKVFENTMKELS